MRRVFVFPGQGSQSVGMLAELAATDSSFKDTFAEASAILGYDLWHLVQTGPAEKLSETTIQQPAMLAAGVAMWRHWIGQGGARPEVVCGHSLGEFSALTAAESLKFSDAVKLVKRRAELMQEAVPAGVGAIAAILGLDEEAVTAACAEATQGEVVELVNFNSPGQLVIAGHSGAVGRALDGCKARGAKRAVLLAMSVPAHSSLMQPAAERFAVELAAADLRSPQLEFWSPVDAQRHSGAEEIRALLVRQLASPVRWADLIRALGLAGAISFVECGPGSVLTGLNRRIDRRPEVECHALGGPSGDKRGAPR